MWGYALEPSSVTLLSEEIAQLRTELEPVFKKYEKDKALMEFYGVYMNSIDKYDPRLHDFSPNYIDPEYYNVKNFEKPYYKMSTAYSTIMDTLAVAGIAICVLGIILPEPVSTAVGAGGIKGATAGIATKNKSIATLLQKAANITAIASNTHTAIEFSIAILDEEYDEAFGIAVSKLLSSGSISNKLWRGRVKSGYISYSDSRLWRLDLIYISAAIADTKGKSIISSTLKQIVNDVLQELNKDDIVTITEEDINNFFDIEMVELSMPKPFTPYPEAFNPYLPQINDDNIV